MIFKRQDPRNDTLDFVNSLRATMGGDPLEKLRPGVMEKYTKCTIFNSLEDVCAGKLEDVHKERSYVVKIAGRSFSMPPRVQDFVNKYDEGKYPELDSAIVEISKINQLEAIPTANEAEEPVSIPS